jgi:hypothetical protein
MMHSPECTGVCQFCIEEHEGGAPVTKLYRRGKRLMCADCACEAAGNAEFALLAYGEVI